jgi:RluA family pseudouridine synthase
MSLKILHEDDALIAVDKPCGQPVVPGRGEVGLALIKEIESHLPRKPYVVHRLDLATSGLVLFAKTSAAHKTLSQMFESHSITKRYLALAQGLVAHNDDITTPIKQFGSGRMGVAEDGKPSVTRFIIQKRLKGATLLDVKPESGRRHQIRVHFYSIAHPLLGDPLYGEARPVGGVSRLMLHATKLKFSHPDLGDYDLRCAPPADFDAIVAKYA